MSELSWNDRVIKEFRENGGKVGGQFEGAPLLLLHSTGAKSGKERVNPMMYLPEDDRLMVFASKGGAPTNPDWYHNLLANSRARIEIGTDEYDVEARALEGDERTRVFNKQAELYAGFREYQDNTDRVIPVVELKRV